MAFVLKIGKCLFIFISFINEIQDKFDLLQFFQWQQIHNSLLNKLCQTHSFLNINVNPRHVVYGVLWILSVAYIDWTTRYIKHHYCLNSILSVSAVLILDDISYTFQNPDRLHTANIFIVNFQQYVSLSDELY